ncbi:hypothetical protein KCU73_g6521, partial [Aureobasidium melanogenum]
FDVVKNPHAASGEHICNGSDTWVTTNEGEMLILEMARADLTENKDKRSHLKMTQSIQHKVIQNSMKTDMSMDKVFAGKDFQFLSQVDGGTGSAKTFVCQLIIDHVNQLAQTKNQPTTGSELKRVNKYSGEHGIFIHFAHQLACCMKHHQRLVRSTPDDPVTTTEFSGKVLDYHTDLMLSLFDYLGTGLDERCTGAYLISPLAGPPAIDLGAEHQGGRYASPTEACIAYCKIVASCTDMNVTLPTGVLDPINDRLKTISGSDKDFGGKSVIFSGDLFQLPPVGGTPMFMVNPLANSADKDLEQLYSRINKSVFLTEPMRQKDAAFDAELTKIRNSDSDAATSDYISSRVSANMQPPQQDLALLLSQIKPSNASLSTGVSTTPEGAPATAAASSIGLETVTGDDHVSPNNLGVRQRYVIINVKSMKHIEKSILQKSVRNKYESEPWYSVNGDAKYDTSFTFKMADCSDRPNKRDTTIPRCLVPLLLQTMTMSRN